MGDTAERTSSREDRFVVRGQLGAGGMGVVYRVYDRAAGREVALKTLKATGARDLYRFKREFRALCDLAHPNLCRLHELHTTGDEWFFTMELVPGRSFIDWVRPSADDDDPAAAATDPARPPTDDDTLPPVRPPRSRADILAASLSPARLEAALYQLCDGVHALHVAGKLHRDLKPSNVLVDDTGRVVLLDFGLVADVELAGVDHTHERAAVGTPAYMSPEQAADTPLTSASDWYSVGVMLYEALTGRRPFEGRPDELMRRKQVEVPPRARALAPTCPADLDLLCARLLAIDPRDRPDGVAILRALGREPSEATRTVERTVGVAAPFVGRVAQLGELNQALVDSRRAGVTVFVHGASGMGKSVLVNRFLDGLTDRALVLAGRCYEREAVPYKTLDTLIDALTGALLRLPPTQLGALLPDDITALARLFPVLRRVPQIAEPIHRRFQPTDPQELRRRGWNALRVLLTRLATQRPLVIVVDDLQWGDDDSVGFLVELIARADRPPLLLVLLHRTEDRDGAILSAIHKRITGGSIVPDVRTLEVLPLALDEATDLVATLSGLPGGSSEWAESLVRDAGGNTLFLSELARSAVSANGAATLDELLRARIAGLPDDARAVLRAVAVAGRPMAPTLAAAGAGLTDASGAIATLRAERLIRAQVGRDQLEPYHDRIRSAVVDELATGELVAAHRELAVAYQRTAPDDREPLVDHLLGAGERQAAAEHAIAAAAAAAEALAFRRAADLYAIALEAGTFDDAHRYALLLSRGAALVNAGQLHEAARLYELARPLAPEEERGELDRQRMEQLLRSGHLDDGLALARTALAAIGCELPSSRRATVWNLVSQRVLLAVRGTRFRRRTLVEVARPEARAVDLLWSVCSGLSFADPVLGKVVQLWHLRRALALGEPRRVAMALALEVGYLASTGDVAEAKIAKVAARAREVAADVGDPFVIGLVESTIGLADFLAGRRRSAHELMDRGRRSMRDHGSGGRWELDLTELFFLANLFYAGELAELARLTPILLREAEERGDVYSQHGLRSWRSNVAWLVMGKPADARAHALGVAIERGEHADFHLHDYYQVLANGQIDLYVGDGDGALARVERAWRDLERSLLLRVQTVRIEAHFLLGRAALASTRADRGAVVRRAVATLEGESAAWGPALGALLTAGASLRDGARDRAVRELAAAEDRLRGAELALHAQVARLARGELVGGAAGRALADQVLGWMAEQGVVEPASFARMILPRP
ncbi:MAG: protein kinase [Kofleriaceae bacterium]|nr:protein kinase [Kofleriaceae bacterium]MBP9169313.1 protein kinase [Kofleriaceae bacterium]MBP9861104.1 protein kinase [Kofleriaceae bacterium]